MSKKTQSLSKDEIKQAASGRELEILQHVAGIPFDLLDGKNHPCPKCEGTNRFRLIDASAGAVLCNQCFKENNGDYIAAVRHFRGVEFREALQLIADYLGTADSGTSSSRTTKEWVYTDRDGNPLYKAVRQDWTENGKPRKTFFQKRKTPTGWENGLGSVQLVPYNLPHLAGTPTSPVIIVEGEKCVDALQALGIESAGFIVTTASGGSNTKLDWAQFIKGREVTIFPDNDKPGFQYALAVADSLLPDELGNSLKVLFLPDLEHKGDVADWIEHGGTLEQLLNLIEKTPTWTGERFAYQSDEESTESGQASSESEPKDAKKKIT